jgi:hypothetical protein
MAMEFTSIPFEADTPYGVFKSTLWVPADANLSDDEIAALKQAQVDNYIAACEAVPEVIEEIPQDG